MQPCQQRHSNCQNSYRNPELHIGQNCFQHWINLTASFPCCQSTNPGADGIATSPEKSEEFLMTTVYRRSYNVGVTGGFFSCTPLLLKSPWNISTTGTISLPAAIRRAKLRKSSATMTPRPIRALPSFTGSIMPTRP